MGSKQDGNQNKHVKPLLVELNGRLFDVAQFASQHPGGEKVLRQLAGEKVDEYMRGEKRILGVKHEHSEAAYKMLEKYDVKQYHKVGMVNFCSCTTVKRTTAAVVPPSRKTFREPI